MRHTRTALGSMFGLLSLVGLVSACGDPITASRNWQATATLSTLPGGTEPTRGGYLAYITDKISGPLADEIGKQIPGTTFAEACKWYLRSSGPLKTKPVKPSLGPMPCTILVNTGRQVYVASGVSSAAGDDFSGTFKSLASRGSSRTITVVAVPHGGDLSRVASTYSLSISLR